MLVTYEWKMWAIRVNNNYHEGNMTENEAEIMAGTEPEKYYSSDICPTCNRKDDNHWLDRKHLV